MADIKIDLNKITRREFRAFTAALTEAKNGIATDELTADIVAKVITDWPYGDVTADAYLDMPLEQSLEVDQALSDAFEFVSKKK